MHSYILDGDGMRTIDMVEKYTDVSAIILEVIFTHDYNIFCYIAHSASFLL